MPEIGEIRRASEIGKFVRPSTNPKRTIRGQKFIWYPCVDCGKERWVRFTNNQPYTQKCHGCHVMDIRRFGKDNRGWTGGRIRMGRGKGKYWITRVYEDDFSYPMAMINGYVLEHRLVMAKHLGRNLHSWEIVHHKGTKYPSGSRENRDDNRIENLQLVSDDKHKQITILENRIRHLEVQNKKLREKLSKRK